MKKLTTITTLLMAFTLSCTTTRILPDKPVTGNLPDAPARLSSFIKLPVAIDISSIEQLINAKLPSGVLASDNRREGNTTRYSYEVKRNRPVKFSAVGNELIFKVPIDIDARGSYTACVGFWTGGRCCSVPNPFGGGCAVSGITSTEHGNSSPSVDLELRIKLVMQEDYSVRAETYFNGSLSGDHHLHIDLIGNLIRINIDIRDKLEPAIRRFVNDYKAEINTKVNELLVNYDLKSMVNSYWGQLHEPIKSGDFWLRIEPKSVFFENLNAQGNELRLALGFASNLEISSIQPNVQITELPNLTIAQNMPGEFHIHLPVHVPFEFLETKIMEDVQGKTYGKDGVKVKIKDVSIQGVFLNNATALLIKANVRGRYKLKRFKGDIYFTAIPGLDDSSKLMFIKDFKIDPNTNSFLLNNGLPYLIDKFYYERIKNDLQYSFKQQYEDYTTMIQQELDSIQIDHLLIQGQLHNINVPGFYIGERYIEILLLANGKLNSVLILNENVGE